MCIHFQHLILALAVFFHLTNFFFFCSFSSSIALDVKRYEVAGLQCEACRPNVPFALTVMASSKIYDAYCMGKMRKSRRIAQRDLLFI